MLTQDQHQYHFKLSDMRSLTRAVSAIHKHTRTHTHTHKHATKRYTFIIGFKHNYHHRQSCYSDVVLLFCSFSMALGHTDNIT